MQPAGVPLDEWLLAIGLANHRPGVWKVWADVPLAMDVGWGDEFDAARSGALDVRLPGGLSAGDGGFPEVYAAGAALAMALEDS